MRACVHRQDGHLVLPRVGAGSAGGQARHTLGTLQRCKLALKVLRALLRSLRRTTTQDTWTPLKGPHSLRNSTCLEGVWRFITCRFLA